jgi:hypothetical protein
MSTRLTLQLAAAAALMCSGCMTAEADLTPADLSDSEDVSVAAAVAPKPIALRAGASVEPSEYDGYCEQGVGVYLSADEVKAELTLYVVYPAERAVFERLSLQLSTQAGSGDVAETEVREIETIELRAGESRTFTEYAEGTLMAASAEVSAL